ncbi:MAG: hypothetical protein ACO1NN_07695 [Sphingopyxis sp.]
MMNAGRGHSVIFDCTPVLIIDRVIIYEAGRLSCLAAKLPGNRPLRPDAQTTIVLGRAELATLSRRIEEGLVFFLDSPTRSSIAARSRVGGVAAKRYGLLLALRTARGFISAARRPARRERGQVPV